MKTNQVTGVRTECPSGIKRLLEDRKLNRMANEMAAYLAKHPDDKPRVWVPPNGTIIQWQMVTDINGRIVVCRYTPMNPGDMYEFGLTLVISKWNRDDVPLRGKVMAQISMEEVWKFARRKLTYRPYVYDIHCD